MNKEDLKKIRDLIEGIDFAMLVSKSSSGELRSRPMTTQQMDESGSLWFFSDKDSAKIFEIEEFSQVNLAYSDHGKQIYVSVSGSAEVSYDQTKIDELFKPSHKTWFPMGKDDPALCLIKVHATFIEYWDSRISKMAMLWGASRETKHERISIIDSN